VQPSVGDVADVVFEYCPAGQFLVWQVVAVPPSENVPASQVVQPSVAVVAPPTITAAYSPAGHVMLVQEVTAPPSEYVPGLQSEQPSVGVVAAVSVEY